MFALYMSSHFDSKLNFVISWPNMIIVSIWTFVGTSLIIVISFMVKIVKDSNPNSMKSELWRSCFPIYKKKWMILKLHTLSKYT